MDPASALMALGQVAQCLTKCVEPIKDAIQAKRLTNQLKDHQCDLTRALEKANKIAKMSFKELKDLQCSIIRKQCRLAGRTLIPLDIRTQGNDIYSDILQQINNLRKKHLAAA